MFSVTRMTSGKIPLLPFQKIQEAILSTKYSLSLVFTTTKLATTLHKKYKHEGGPANILSFPYSQNEGEIFIHLGTIRSQAKFFNHTYHQHLTFMYIHGLLHLKGMDHGKKMEDLEKKFMKKFWG